jgi:hypothetical protein
LRPYFKKSFTKIGLVAWLKAKALSSSPSTTKNILKKGPIPQEDIAIPNRYTPNNRAPKYVMQIC